ncbi:hypothetical protein VLK31_07010 [Variovorax sp. H27-G14]|uniref:hypothetical protein n=1 Tax=Variovorax sp. H27-G14 TaxID=3111914 RepID=UPI0038FC1A1A
MSQDTGYHAPVVLADAREKRARRQRPYPACVELKDLQGFEGAGQHESAQRDVRSLFGAMAAVVVVLLVLVVLTVRHLLKG